MMLPFPAPTNGIGWPIATSVSVVLFPEAWFPATHYVIGCWREGGCESPWGVLLEVID